MAEQKKATIDLSIEIQKYETKLTEAMFEEVTAHDKASGLRGAIAAMKALIAQINEANAPAAVAPEPQAHAPAIVSDEPEKILAGPGSESAKAQ